MGTTREHHRLVHQHENLLHVITMRTPGVITVDDHAIASARACCVHDGSEPDELGSIMQNLQTIGEAVLVVGEWEEG